MQANSVRPVLYALLVSSLVGPPAYAAGTGASGGETAGTTEAIQRQDLGAIAGDGERDAAKRNAPIKGREATVGGSNAAGSAARVQKPAALPHAGGRIALHGHSSLPVAHAYVSKPAIGAVTHAYLIRRPGTAMGAVGGISPMTALPAIRRPSSGIGRAANPPVASLKAAAGNGVIGGAPASGRGMIGGPLNTASMIKAGINGTTLHRRS
jgi:hypothetical protein